MWISQPDHCAVSNDGAWLYLHFAQGDESVVVAIHVRSQLKVFKDQILAAFERAKALDPGGAP